MKSGIDYIFPIVYFYTAVVILELGQYTLLIYARESKNVKFFTIFPVYFCLWTVQKNSLLN